jgi:hypothetical protein
MQRLNQKENRILKLHQKGLDAIRIAKKIGYASNLLEGLDRVSRALQRAKELNLI